MKYITFPGAGMLASLATMLEFWGHETSDEDIAWDMEAPFLFVHRDGKYRAGMTLYQPEWLNIYLHPHGFSMTSQTLQRAEIPAFLRNHKPPVLLPVQVRKGRMHPVVFQKYEDNRYYFINIRSADDNTEPDELSLSSDMLKRRLDEQVDVFMLTECEPTEIDVVPILLDSLRTLTAYEADLLASRPHEYTREEFAELREPLFRAIALDYVPLADFLDDRQLDNEITQLNHSYKHVFPPYKESVDLRERLSLRNIKKCILYIRENIYDRLCDLDVPDEVLEMAHKL